MLLMTFFHWMLPLVILFVLFLIFIPIGAAIASESDLLGLLSMLCAGMALLFGVYFFRRYLIDGVAIWRWVDFIGVFVLIGMMNQANVRGETTPMSKTSSTGLFGGAALISIVMFWL